MLFFLLLEDNCGGRWHASNLNREYWPNVIGFEWEIITKLTTKRKTIVEKECSSNIYRHAITPSTIVDYYCCIAIMSLSGLSLYRIDCYQCPSLHSEFRFFIHISRVKAFSMVSSLTANLHCHWNRLRSDPLWKYCFVGRKMYFWKFLNFNWRLPQSYMTSALKILNSVRVCFRSINSLFYCSNNQIHRLFWISNKFTDQENPVTANETEINMKGLLLRWHQ